MGLDIKKLLWIARQLIFADWDLVNLDRKVEEAQDAEKICKIRGDEVGGKKWHKELEVRKKVRNEYVNRKKGKANVAVST